MPFIEESQLLIGSERLPLVVIVGPTAVGKTEVAIQLAERMGGEIVSADSRLFYRGMDIGTAKPTLEERARVPHHLIDVAEPDQVWNLAIFQQAAWQAIDNVHAHRHLPFLVGGTGQYVHSVIEGWRVPAVVPDPRMREALEVWADEIGPQALHARLAVLDPRAASGIDYRNLRRTVRALEVIFQTGRRFSAQRQRSESPYRTLILGLNRPRPELYERIDARIDAMLAAGLVEEVKTLLELGFDRDLPTLSAIGYQEIIAYLEGKISLEQASTLMKRHTRQYVRRQANWFKSDDPTIRWFLVGVNTVYAMEHEILAWLNRQESQVTG
jgi:tRNA dimethylallyltransferase